MPPVSADQESKVHGLTRLELDPIGAVEDEVVGIVRDRFDAFERERVRHG